ncbi:MAG: DUF5668 domain-containing protein [Ekhidna sp.]|uniref:LiaF transmembrane domain-containing protein n=1 Tax=Ekhidna sp. TaxID=2608089 RepID=UPI0032F06D80
MTRHENSNSKLWLGIVLVTIGSYFLLRNLDLIPSFLPHWLFSWEMIFVVAGGGMLASGRKEGLVFIAIGAFFVLPDIMDFPRYRMRDWWPVILIAIGLSIFLRRRSYNRPASSMGDEYFDDTSIFGGSEKSITSQSLKGGKISSVFGGSTLNMRDVKLGQREVLIDYLCIFGGNEIIVPNDWTIINEAFVMFGGFSDTRAKISGVTPDPEKIVRIKGLILFGGTELRGG